MDFFVVLTAFDCLSFLHNASWRNLRHSLVLSPWDIVSDLRLLSVADPGFPVGGYRAVRGGASLRCVCFSVKMYAKIKELDPVGGDVPVAPPNSPGSANVYIVIFEER